MWINAEAKPIFNSTQFNAAELPAHSVVLFSLSLHSHCIQQILEAVLHCHQMGVVHRDLKVRFKKEYIERH